MKKLYSALILLFLSTSVFSQIGGLSSSKLLVFTAQTVPAGAIEFEPSWGFASSKSVFDNNGKINQLSDSMRIESVMNFRFTYGAIKNFEIGAILSSDMEDASFGAKYHFASDSKFQIAAMIGSNILLGNRKINIKNEPIGNYSYWNTGIILNYNFSEKFSTDLDIQYQQGYKKTNNKSQFINFDAGYYISKKVQLLGGFSQLFYHTQGVNQQLSSCRFGTTLEYEQFLIALGVPFDIAGKNADKTIGFSFALTILFK